MNSHNHEQQFQQNTQMGSGLTRYRSAPSSYFASLLSTPSNDGGFGAADFEQLFNPRASSPETQMIFSRFMNSSSAVQPPITPPPPPPPPPAKLEAEEYQSQLQLPSNDFSSAPQMMYSSADTSYSKVLAPPPPKMEHSSGLIRHSSSPAGLFANINIENELKTMGSYGGGNSANAEATFSSANRVMNYSSSTSSRHTPSGMISTISENSAVDTQFDDDHGNDMDYITWDDSSLLSDPYLKGLGDNNNQKYEAGNRPTTQLSHHLSLPKSSAAMDKLLQDSVPCRTRAKRGCATHPRSIAERVRRTKISERMRKLQELVPNMEKQTNTSDMLDLAVDYIKDLQNQLKTLSGNHAKCTCSAKQRS